MGAGISLAKNEFFFPKKFNSGDAQVGSITRPRRRDPLDTWVAVGLAITASGNIVCRLAVEI
jgi:hypothetical protein